MAVFSLKNKNLIIDSTILLLITAIFFWKVLFFDRFALFCSDYTDLFSIHCFSASQLKNGLLPLWDPYYLGPIGAMSLAATFYPFNFFMDFLMSRAGEASNSLYIFNLNLVFHFFLGSFFMYLLMRRIGLKRISCIFSGVIFAFGGSFVGHVPHPMRINASIWLPLTFLFFIKANHDKWIYSLVAGLFLGLSFLAGGPQYSLFICLILILYACHRTYSLYKLERSYKSCLIPMRNCIIIFLIALGVSAVQILPTLEYASFSGRAKPVFDMLLALGNSSPATLIKFISPNFFAAKLTQFWWGSSLSNVGVACEANLYVGVLTLIFAALAVLSTKRNLVKFFFGLLFLSVLLMLGRYTILSGWFFLLPGLGNARLPVRYFFMANFSLAVLCGLGLDIFTDPLLNWQRKYLNIIIKYLNRFLIAFISVSLPIFIAFLFLNKFSHNFDQKLIAVKSVLLFSLIFIVGVFLLNKIRRSSNPVSGKILVLIVLLAIFDLFIFQITFNPILPTQTPEEWSMKGKTVDHIKQDSGIFRMSGINGYKLLYNKIYSKAFGYTGSFGLARTVEFENLVFQDFNSPLFDLYNMKYVFRNAFDGSVIRIMHNGGYKVMLDNGIVVDSKFANSLKLGDRVKIVAFPEVYFQNLLTSKFKRVQGVTNLFENKEFMPRAFVVNRYKVVPDDRRIFEELKRLDPKQYIILKEEPQFSEMIVNQTNESNTKIRKYSPGDVEVEVEMSSPGFLFISDIWYPGWEVYVDNTKSKLYQANYIFMAVELDKGGHTVNFKYNPISFKIGVVISILTVIFVVLSFVLSKSWKKKK